MTTSVMSEPTRALPRAMAGLACLVMLGADASPAFAHAAERGFVMLLPTGYYKLGGALAVFFSFVILAFVPAKNLARMAAFGIDLAATARFETLRMLTSTISFVLLLVLVAAGWLGAGDPLSNPLPLVFWSLFWVGLTIVQGFVGNVWAFVNPWSGPLGLVNRLRGHRTGEAPNAAPMHGSWRPGSFLALAFFAAFAWFELVDIAPADPPRLALAISFYWTVHFIAMLIVGERRWSRQAEAFTVFFTMIGRFSIIGRLRPNAVLRLTLPGARLVSAPALTWGGTLFLLFALSSVSFDGLLHTFTWFAINGLNPLEFAGRSTVLWHNTIGLAGMFACLAGGFVTAVFIGERMAKSHLPLMLVTGRLVWSIIPISLGYHFAHYIASLVTSAQYALKALSDPFSRGWNLLGTADMHVHAGLTLGHDSAWVIWNLQAAAIIGGHVLAVAIAHIIADSLHREPRQAMLSQTPLCLLMIAYTVFGLWLLSTPTVG